MRSAASDPQSNAHPRYRPDIDGLRAIAVLAVVAYHAFPGFVPGGFVGVDVFFVISGYLISTIVFSSLYEGRFSFADFYRRRVNRIFPALVLVLASCCAFGWFALFGDEYKLLSKHVVGGAGFVANLLSWREAGYFDKAAELKPLLHLWSLGVEEQFYLAWPLMLFLGWKRRLDLLALIAAVAAASFLANVVAIRDHAAAVFYLPFSRFWELLLGAALAYVKVFQPAFSLRLGARSRERRDVEAVIGLLLIACAVFGLDQKKLFPGWWALLPTFGAFLVITAGPDAWLNRHLLSRRAAVWVGLISYPLYLWHWPLLSFLRIVESGPPTPGYRLAAISLSVVLAWLTVLLVEQPARAAPRGGSIAVALSLLLVGVGCAGGYLYKKDGVPARITYPAEQYREVLFPDVEECHRRYPFTKDSYCGLSSLTTAPSILVMGDSHSRAYFTGLREYFNRSGRSFLSTGVGGCPPFLGVTIQYGGATSIDCDRVTRDALGFLASADDVKTVILAGSWSEYTGTPGALVDKDRRHPDTPENLFARGLDDVLTRIEGLGKKVVFLHQVPQLEIDPRSCRPRPFRISADGGCGVRRSTVVKLFAKYEALTARVFAKHPKSAQIRPIEFFCDSDFCPATRSGVVIYFDNNHINQFGSRFFGSQLSRSNIILTN